MTTTVYLTNLQWRLRKYLECNFKNKHSKQYNVLKSRSKFSIFSPVVLIINVFFLINQNCECKSRDSEFSKWWTFSIQIPTILFNIGFVDCQPKLHYFICTWFQLFKSISQTILKLHSSVELFLAIVTFINFSNKLKLLFINSLDYCDFCLHFDLSLSFCVLDFFLDLVQRRDFVNVLLVIPFEVVKWFLRWRKSIHKTAGDKNKRNSALPVNAHVPYNFNKSGTCPTNAATLSFLCVFFSSLLCFVLFCLMLFISVLTRNTFCVRHWQLLQLLPLFCFTLVMHSFMHVHCIE